MKLERLKERILEAQALRDGTDYMHSDRWSRYRETRDNIVGDALIELTDGRIYGGDPRTTHEWLETLLTLYTK